MPYRIKPIKSARKKIRTKDHRPSAAKRGYNSTWRKLRKLYLAKHPMCEHCRVLPACDVDHIKPLSDGGKRLSEDNLQALCRGCHVKKTWKERKESR